MSELGDDPRRRSRLPEGLAQQLEHVEPSVDYGLRYRPCRVTLIDGTCIDRVYVQEVDECWQQSWGFDPDDDEIAVLAVDEIASIEESPTRLPVRFANALYEAGESAMGGTFFALTFRDGSLRYFSAGNAVDFIDWPDGVGPDDVDGVVPHVGRMREDRIESPGFVWALYER